MAIVADGMYSVSAHPDALFTADAPCSIKNQLGTKTLNIRFFAPDAVQRASLYPNDGAHPGSMANASALDIEQTGFHEIQLLILSSFHSI